ncbi:tRNA (adenosine(37)-N6)-threonylcarbamoyltransferase complex ATPase subunit type 1 TsaE [Leeuwenhoekiella sp. A16]|uniref:tRNA (adenosine(37)-N6)-threonylcarbamoyltransferase complex ATPase subunit type 1 TsaE n=1 Tax=unclassified Leeuwenhoekiella TaxID=2615029 RepID=UPI003A80A51B
MNIVYNLSEIDSVARKVLANSQHKTILFYGEMGAGKTTLIKSLCKELGASDQASSPTFSIVNEYNIIGETPIYHFDFYRLKDENEALDMGIEEYFASGGWIFIEWPEKINNFLPAQSHSANLISINDTQRNLSIS